MDNLEPITRNEMFLNGDDLEPITREEMILAGADLEPITRHEWFLKKYRGGGGGGGYDLVNIPNLPADIASFNDGTDLPMASLKVAVTPYQDLHGYDAPWAGGAGKNKFGGEYNQFFPLHFSSEVTITASADLVSGTAPQIAYYDENKTQIDYWGMASQFSSLSNRIARTITYPTTAYYVKFITTETTNYQIEVSSTNTSYAPYSNICPISGWDEANVTVADDVETPTVSNVYTIDLDGTRYGGELDVVSGVLTLTDGFISSYNGETLPSTWISDRDVYAEGTTPTIGAEVVYTRATPITVQLSPTPVKSLEGVNNINANCGQITEVKYFKKA